MPLPAATPARVLLVDLNNHARYPTIAVGLLTAVLRRAGHPVRLLSPLAVGVSGVARDAQARPWSLLDERLRWWSARTGTPGVKRVRQWLEARRRPDTGPELARIETAFADAFADEGPDVVLVSAYSMYADAVKHIARRAGAAGVPVLVGGPGFTDLAEARRWLDFEGVTAVFAGEVEAELPALVEAAARGAALDAFDGCLTRTRPDAPIAAPLTDLDTLPFPDYDDFPWDRYPTPIVSMLTGRGCGWGRCTFCSDVFTSNGRTFRSRSAANVLGELRHHHERYGVTRFHFSDLKLNSDLDLWRGLIAGFRDAVPGALWTASVHAGGKGDQGLGPDDLRAAREAGLVRITTGLETASTTLLSKMAKGVSRAALERFLDAAHGAGISVRVSAFTGYPGETAQDVAETADLLEGRAETIDRVHMSRFLILPGTPIGDAIAGDTGAYPELDVHFGRHRTAPPDHVDRRMDRRSYRRQVNRVLRAVHRINARPLPEFARPLEGAM